MQRKVRLTPVRLMVLGFLAVIVLGTVLLLMPFATRSRECAGFINAFFTTVSASCVTGLVLQDTYQYWSLFGQIVILFLIQIGGVGFMTVVFLVLKLGGRKIGLKERAFMQESINAPTLGGMIRMSSTILLGTLIFESLGAFVLCFRFVPDFGWGRGIYFSIFTSVSALCNAGFDLMGAAGIPFASMTAYIGDAIICITIPLLIIIGGLGFFVWKDLRENKFRFRKYSLHTKLVLTTSLVMIAVPFILILIAERDLPWGERILGSFFSAVAPRTAGFNVLNMSALRPLTMFVTIICMFIGGSSGSTAGGIKTNTFAVLVLSIFSSIRGKRSVECFGRRLDEEDVKKASLFVTLYFLFCLLGVILLCIFEARQGYSLSQLVFETVSAIGTVGLTTGITPALHVGSHITLAVLMFLGRAGCMTVMLTLRTPPQPAAELPVERVRIA